MKSIKELATELNVSDRTISRHIRKLNIKTYRQGNVKQLDEQAQEILRQVLKDRLSDKPDNLTDKPDNLTDKPDNLTDKTDSQTDGKADTTDKTDRQPDNLTDTDFYKSKCEMLQQQLEQMQKYIDTLNADKEQLYKQIDTLSAALTNAQALLGIEKQQKFIESKSDVDELEQPKQKKGFFARLFNR